MRLRHVVLVLGDQLSLESVAFEGFDAARDRVLMVEAREESEYVPSAKMRSVLFLSAMRHFAHGLREDGIPLVYRELSTAGEATTLASELSATLASRRVQRVVLTEPGDWRVLQALRTAVGDVSASRERISSWSDLRTSSRATAHFS